METKTLQPCIVENGLNTCYISSLFTAMFYKSSEIDKILDKDPKDGSCIFLQEIIKIKFVEPVRRHFSISSGIMNEIRNYSVVCGWCKDTNYIDEQQDVSEFYIFIINCLATKYIEFEKITSTPDLKENKSLIEKLPYIPLHPIEKEESVRELLKKWIFNNIINEDEKNSSCHYYKLSNLPSFIPLHINRFNSSGSRITSSVDIMERIMFFNVNDTVQKNMRWKIHSIVCHKGTTVNSGHYYSLCVSHDRKWYLFDDNMIPSIKQIDIDDDDIKMKIKEECMFLFYVIE